MKNGIRNPVACKKIYLFVALCLILLNTTCSLAEAQSKRAPSDLAEEALKTAGIQTSAPCSQSKVFQDIIPQDFIRANPPWGPQKFACDNGGFKLEAFSGKHYATLNCPIKAWLDSGGGKRCQLRAYGFVVEGALACMYLVAEAECGLAPGIMAIDAIGVIKG